jgi:hypothetical protein
MASEITGELASFVEFAKGQLVASQAGLTPEQCLALYRAEHPTDAELAAGFAAVNEAIYDMRKGDNGTPLEQFEQELRTRNRIHSEN